MAGMMLFDEIIEKFNPYHDRLGRFATSGNFTSFTYSPGKSRAHDLAIERQKERMAGIMPTEAQGKTLKGIESRTRNLKKEQFRVVDREGNVVMQKQGDKNSVSYSVGEARDHFPGNVTIHNHPDGGTFSSADLSDFGYGATEIRAASPEGTYTLRNMNYKTKWTADQKGWYEMRGDLDAASQEFKNYRQMKQELRKPYEAQVKPISEKWAKRQAEGASQEELKQIADEYTKTWDALKPQMEQAARKAYVDQYHSWYQSNAGNYGFEYSFTPTSTRTRKSDAMFDEIEKGADGDIVLDRKIKEDVDDIVAEILSEYPREIGTEEAKKSFHIFKTDDDKRLVFGWASVSIKLDGEQLEDRQKDMIDPEDLEEAAYEYVLHFRDTGEEHIPTMRKKGKLVESCVFTEEKQRAMGIPPGTLPIAWWIGFKIEDDSAWEKVKNGTYRMFSIEGRANREPVEKRSAEAVASSTDGPERGRETEGQNGLFQVRDGGKPCVGSRRSVTMQRGGDQVAKSFLDVLNEMPARTIEKSDPNRFDVIVEHPQAVQKFNPYHDAKGRFASASGAASFTYAPGKSEAHDLAIARANAKDRVAKAKEAEPKLTAMMSGCAKAAGGEMVGLEYAVKGEGSLTRKIRTEMKEKGCTAKEATDSMKDVNRYTMQLNESNFVSGYESTMKTLASQGHELVRVKNTMGDTSASYRGVNCNIKGPDGSIWELQFHTAKSLEVKEVNHKLYETQRLDKTPAAKKAELGAAMAKNAASIPSPVGIEKIVNINKL